MKRKACPTCQRRDLVWKARLGTVAAGLLVLYLAVSGRAWAGPKYPIGMILLVLQFSIMMTGFILARALLDGKDLSTRAKAGAGRREDVSWIPTFLGWLAVIVCIIGRWWFGWYVVLGVLLWSSWRSERVHTSVEGNTRRLPRAAPFLMVIFIVYVLLSKSFFSQ